MTRILTLSNELDNLTKKIYVRNLLKTQSFVWKTFRRIEISNIPQKVNFQPHMITFDLYYPILDSQSRTRSSHSSVEDISPATTLGSWLSIRGQIKYFRHMTSIFCRQSSPAYVADQAFYLLLELPICILAWLRHDRNLQATKNIKTRVCLG